jgi:hypothetical protein
MSTIAGESAGEFKLAEPIWVQGKHEPKLWFERFNKYLRMGRKRSKLAVYRQERLAASDVSSNSYKREKAGKGGIKSVPHAWDGAADRYQWRKRAEAFDDHELLEDQEQWKEKHRKDREIEHQCGGELLERAKEMMSYPLAKVECASGVEAVTEPGRRAEIIAQLRADGLNEEDIDRLEAMPIMVVSITQIQPMRWQMRDAATLAQTGAMLMRQATGAPTSYEQHEVVGPKGKDGQQRSLFPIQSITIVDAPKKPLPGLNGDAAAADRQQQGEEEIE